MQNKFLTVVLVIAATALGIYFGLKQSDQQVAPPEIAGLVYPQSRAISEFKLVDQDGDAFSNEQLKGKWSFLYFGYTFCPDICPITLNHFKGLKRKLEPSGERADVEFMLISVDPARDTPERLKEYVAFFDEDFKGATGEQDQLTTLAKDMSVVYVPVKNENKEENYLVDHSSTVVLINPNGKLHAVFTAPHTVEDFEKGFRDIREHWEQISAS